MSVNSESFQFDNVHPADEAKAGEIKFALEICKVDELPMQVLDAWQAWHRIPTFHSPYFHPEFTRCMARVRDDVRVAVLRDENQRPIGVLPYQSPSGKRAEPIGGALNDYHGVIGGESLKHIPQAEVIRKCGFQQFRFHAWHQPDSSLAIHTHDQDCTRIADISAGSGAFLDELRKQSTTVKRQPQKTRKMMRELGPIRLELDCRDVELLEWTIQKKREKYQRTGVVDFFGVEWTRNLLREIHQKTTGEFGGMLSVLFAGKTVVAAHFGMRAEGVLHYWYPIYDKKYHQYSPGTQLFLEIAKRAEDNGINLIDFGYGTDSYKWRLTNSQSFVTKGCIDFNPFRRKLAKTWHSIVERLKASRVKEPLKNAVRAISPNAGQPRV